MRKYVKMLEDALLAVDDNAALDIVRENAQAIYDSLDEGITLSERRLEKLPPAWVAHVRETLLDSVMPEEPTRDTANGRTKTKKPSPGGLAR